jgi:hypothetical protein
MPLKASRRQARAYQLNLEGGADEVTPRKQRFDEEHRHQVLLFDRRLQFLEKYPDLRWMFSTLNGIYIPPALLDRAKDAGLIRGVFDVFLPIGRRDRDGTHACGLAIEVKKLKDWRPSKEQKEWAARLVQAGWRVYFCPGAVDAWRCVASYLGISGQDHWASDLQKQEEYIRLLANPQI